jgi:hypothetical protein
MGWKSAGFVAVALAALTVAACGGKPSSTTSGGIPVGTASPTVAPATSFPGTTPRLVSLVPQERISLAAGPTALLPGTINLDTGVPVQLTISNSGGPCLFFIRPFLQGLVVLQGQTDVVTFTPPPAASGQGTEPPTSMGCENEVQRQGQVTFTATNPSALPSSAPLLTATPQPNERSLNVTIANNGLLPNSVTAPYNVPLNLLITNQSGPCLFHFGDTLRGLLIPTNGVAQVLFAIPSTPPILPTATATPSASATAVPPQVSPTTVGCVGDTTRTAPLSFGSAGSTGTPTAGGTATSAGTPSAGSVTPPPLSLTQQSAGTGNAAATAAVTPPGTGQSSAPGAPGGPGVGGPNTQP